ncbi:MAG: hemerythrin domain-containing protein [Polyangiaceae bacterium]
MAGFASTHAGAETALLRVQEGPMALNARAPSFDDDDPTAFLLAVHAEGRALLTRSMQVLRGGTDDVEAIAAFASEMHRFLTFSQPLHELDEECLVLPAILAHAPRAVLDELRRFFVDDHVRLEEARASLAATWSELIAAPSSLPSLREPLRRQSEALVRLLGPHARREERHIFPLIGRYVPLDVQRQMVAVMRSHRTVAVGLSMHTLAPQVTSARSTRPEQPLR